ncbi:M81 family metallopeptidase [Candidatus Poribacteria bacterium]|nr:M81 family metallopeptidase [Candidatus Poribacteria bacterium]
MKKRKFRVAVGQISSESNHFVPSFCNLDFFRATGYVYEGDDLFSLRQVANEIGGILATFERSGDVEIVPLLAARGNSSGPLSASCYTYLKERLLARLRSAGHVDGVILSHHGSMAAENQEGPDGEIASAVREILGDAVPVGMTLDLHGNVTARMVAATNFIIGYEHYPHDDVYTTGVRAANLMLRALRREVKPVTALAKLPLLLTAFNASTLGDGPFAQLMHAAKTLEAPPPSPPRGRRGVGVLSTSMFFVGSYIDVPEIGCSSVVVTDGDAEMASNYAVALARQFWDARHKFVVETMSVADAVRRGRQIEGGPVLLLDTADTTGGGASGDGIGLVKGLLDAGVDAPCLAMVVDPEGAQRCQAVAVGEEVTLDIGHKLDPQWGEPITVTAKVLRKSPLNPPFGKGGRGDFRYRGGILGGAWASMGPSVVLAVGPVHLLVMTYPTYDWADEQYESMGMDVRRAKFVGVKNMMNFRFGYRDIMKGYFVLDLPGPTPADMRALPFQRINRPLFPLDENLQDPKVQISTSGLERM